MKNTMKRMFSLVLVVMLLVCALPMNAMADDYQTPIYIEADVTQHQVWAPRGCLLTGSAKEVSFPSSI